LPPAERNAKYSSVAPNAMSSSQTLSPYPSNGMIVSSARVCCRIGVAEVREAEYVLCVLKRLVGPHRIGGAVQLVIQGEVAASRPAKFGLIGAPAGVAV